MKLRSFAIAVLFAVTGAAQAELLDDNDIQASLIAVSNEMNQMTPIMVDEDTRLDTTVALKRSFMYVYTLVAFDADEIDPDLFLDAIEPLVTREVCSSPDMAGFRDNNIDTLYVYRGKDGNQIASVTIKVSDCTAE
ncbi:MAG: hypothetical protein LAT77_03970 [Aliidiomarina sp.]|uniref:hypothetical protein n=1 Tax=Aliidiomarina sp. TaxID=1872439 RepID=UPI0025B864BA|nr:hypothetical protein [Aliidiomarina sp.]MCH8501056.1 hypothetical protein [Aliidiomarina sp.]